jgi:cytochrome c peroxidase
MRNYVVATTSLVLAGSLALACADDAPAAEETATVESAASSAVESGREIFKHGIPGQPGNGRVCSTCHVQNDAFGLTPAHVQKQWENLQKRRQEDPNADDPLFRSIDANDGAEDFTNLRNHALVRVVLKLPTDANGNKLIWPADDPDATEVSVWRATPSIHNVAFTAPYQQDGRFPDLQTQANGAFIDHSQITTPIAPGILNDLAAFQKTQFSSPRARAVADALAAGQPAPSTDPPLTALEQEGKSHFNRHCVQCHGGPTTTEIDPIMPPVAFDVFVSKPPPPFGEGLHWLPAPVPPRLWKVRVQTPEGEIIAERPSTDPGRALQTGSMDHFNHFQIMPILGMSKTGPWFHDNSATTLEEVVRHYQSGAAAIRRVVPEGVPAPVRPDEILDSEIPALVAYLKKI